MTAGERKRSRLVVPASLVVASRVVPVIAPNHCQLEVEDSANRCTVAVR